MAENRETWGEAMRRVREEHGISQIQLSRKSGIHHNCLNSYEVGRTYPGLFNLVCLADTLGVTIDEYIGRARPTEE